MPPGFSRLIGYELSPGVASSTYLAFTLDGLEGSPEEITLAAGTRAQSVPGQDELPQPFETTDELVARPEWSAFKPRLTYPQAFSSASRIFYLGGLGARLEVGDRTLLVVSETELTPLTVKEITEEPEHDRTRITLADESGIEAPPLPPYSPATGSPGQFTLQTTPMTATTVNSSLYSASWSYSSLTAYTAVQNWSLGQLTQYVAATPPPAAVAQPAEPPPIEEEEEPPTEPTNVVPGLYALREKTAVFGHNAPRYDTLPAEWRLDSEAEPAPAPYPNPWEESLIGDSSAEATYTPEGAEGRVIHLERTFPKVVSGGWAVLQDGSERAAFQVLGADESSLADFALSGKVTTLELRATESEIDRFSRRGTTIWAESESLDLVPLPIELPVEGDFVELELPEFRLAPGRPIAIQGERADLPGVEDGEVVILADVLQVDGRTRLEFEMPLRHPYQRSTVTISANVAEATHGESRSEVLGSGDASVPFQSFALKQAPLTFVSANVPGGAASTLEVRVNGVLWHERPNLLELGPGDRGYVLQRNDDGVTTVTFGDGVRGARLPTGVENVVASYRTGIGEEGLVDRLKINLLATRPLGLRDVTNPVAAAGAEDPEDRDDARENAPATVKTLDRVVSLRDFEDFARAFSGIGKARAARLWDGQRRIVHLTLSDAVGEAVVEPLLSTFRDAIDAVRDAFQPLILGSYEKLLFNVSARLKVHPDYLADDVFKSVETTLHDHFSFARRSLAQRVPASEVLAVIQGVEGVEAVDLETFHYAHEAPLTEPAVVLAAQPARVVELSDGSREIRSGQLLTLPPVPLALEEMT